MSKTVKKLLSMLLCAALLFGVVPLSVDLFPLAKATYAVGDTIQYGTYPQSKVEETTALKNAADSAQWKSYGYYTGTGNYDGEMTPSDYMKFADFFVDSVKYRAVRIDKYRPFHTQGIPQTVKGNSSQFDNGYYCNTTYYFKYEPIIWRVGIPSLGYIQCIDIIDSQAFQNFIFYENEEFYQDVNCSSYANDYSTSSIRKWLNYDFFETAFTDEQKDNIKSTELTVYTGEYGNYGSNVINDKIFIGSNNTSPYSYNGEISSTTPKEGTDYAKSQGLYREGGTSVYSKYSYWRTRYPGSSSLRSVSFNIYGNAVYDFVNYTDRGICPSCNLKELKSDTNVSSNLFSEDASATSVYANDSLTVKGIINKAEESLDDYDHYILTLDEPTQYALYSGNFWLGWNGDQVTIQEIQVDDAGKAFIGKHVEVTGTVIFGHTMHHLTEIVLTDCEYKILEPDTSESNETFYEKSYIADIWLNQHKGVNTYESSELSTFLGYKSISTTLVDALLEDNWFKGALIGWEGFRAVFNTADATKKVSYGISELYEAIIFDLLEKAVEAEAGDYQNIVLCAVESLEKGAKNVSPYMKFINDVVGSIGSSADVVRNLYLEDWHKSNISVGTLMNLDSVKQMSDKITANQVSINLSMFLNEAKSMADFFEMVTSYQLAVNMGDEMKAFLTTMKSTTTDPYLRSALGTVITAVDNANWASIVCTTRFAENTAVNVADAIIKGVINSNVYTAVLNVGYKVGVIASNLLSNTDGIISAYKACVAIETFVDTGKMVIRQLEEKYKNSGSETDAGAYVYAVKTYKDIYILDLERSVNLAKQASQKGLINLTKNKCKSIVNHILDKDETTTYEELCNSEETIKSSLELMFDSLFATWKYNPDYLKKDFPDQYAIYVKEDISSKLYAPQIVSTYLTNDGKTLLNYYNPCIYKDKAGTVHPLFGTAVLEGMNLYEVVDGTVTQTLDFAYGFENQKVTLYDADTFSDFPKTYFLRAYSTDTGLTIYTPASSYELENPLNAPTLVWTRGDYGQNCIGIVDETSPRYSSLMVYHIYRKANSSNSYAEIATINRDTSITRNMTRFVDTTAQTGKLYTYKVQTEMKFSNGACLISSESNEYEVQGRANPRTEALSIEVNFPGRTVKKAKTLAAVTTDGNEGSEGVIINWISDYNPSVYRFELYRKSSYSSTFEKLDCDIKSNVINMLSETRRYEAVDSSVDPGVEYEYLVITYKVALTTSNGSFVACSIYDPVPIAQGTIQIPANDNSCQHNYIGEIIEEATCVNAGVCNFQCRYCSDICTESIPATGKHVDKDNDGKCDVCGQNTQGEYKIKSVSVNDVTINYKAKTTLKPSVTVDEGAKYTVSYSSSNPNVVKVNEKTGEVTGAKKGTATITCTVTDSYGNTVSDTCKVTVKYTVWQWIIIILLFGWIWYK